MTLTAIGLSGFAGSGKTTAAKFIEREYGFERRHIAEPLRDMLRTLLKWNQMAPDLIERYLTGDLKEEVIPCLGITSRRAQFTLGTEWGREMVNPGLWVNTWKACNFPGQKVLNDSVRFPNEETVCDMTIMIVRPGCGPAAFKWGWVGRKLYQWLGLMWGVHDSERVDRLQPTAIVINDGTEGELEGKISSAVFWNWYGRHPHIQSRHFRPRDYRNLKSTNGGNSRAV